MLAKVQQFPSPTPSLADQSITATFDPTAAPGSQFTFDQIFLLIDPDTTVSVSVTLTGGGTWASVPVSWPNPPSNGAPAVTIQSNDPMTISFQAPAPQHYCDPWVFTLNVNSNDLSNIASPLLFLVRNPSLGGMVEFDLIYKSDGSFSLQQGNQAVLALASQQILLNVLPITYNITLRSAAFPNITFYQPQPVIWGNGTLGTPGNPGNPGTPQWLTMVSESNTLNLTLEEPINGQSTGFQFVVVPNPSQPVTVTSPDPIIVNATIGDGT